MKAVKVAAVTVVLMTLAVGALAAQRGVQGVRRYAPRSTQQGPFPTVGLGAIVLRDSALDRFAERLEFTPDQRDQLRVLAESYRSENADLLDRMERMREELRGLQNGETRPSRQAIAEVVERYDHPDLDLDRAHRGLDRDLRTILTPEQTTIMARGARMRAQDPRSRLAARRAVQPRGARRVRDLVRRSPSRYRHAPVNRMRQVRRLPRRPNRP